MASLSEDFAFMAGGRNGNETFHSAYSFSVERWEWKKLPYLTTARFGLACVIRPYQGELVMLAVGKTDVFMVILGIGLGKDLKITLRLPRSNVLRKIRLLN
jgi:hypothetical protein